MPLLLNRLHFPVTVLGPGVRAGVWLQGCTIGCRGCMSQDTWRPEDGSRIQPTEVVRWLAGLPGLSGVTVSGGEPFQQPVPLAALLRAVRDWSAVRSEPVDLMVYSGYTASTLQRNPLQRAAYELCDVVVTGPYVRARAPGGSWRGSANQRLNILTELGADRFGANPGVSDTAPYPNLQIEADGGRWWVVGVPRPGQLDELRHRVAARGITFTPTSWEQP